MEGAIEIREGSPGACGLHGITEVCGVHDPRQLSPLQLHPSLQISSFFHLLFSLFMGDIQDAEGLLLALCSVITPKSGSFACKARTYILIPSPRFPLCHFFSEVSCILLGWVKLDEVS